MDAGRAGSGSAGGDSPAAVPRRTRVQYGLAHAGIFAVEFLIRFHLLKFMTDVAGLRADLAGAAVAIGVLWDAVTDPPMGNISDRTRSRWGRRRPYIAAGGIALAVAVAVLFTPPVIESQTGKFLFLLLSYLFLNTCITVISVPHYALGSELSAETSVRTEAYGWLVFWGQVGSVVGVILPGLALAYRGTPDPAASYRAYSLAALAIAGVVLVTSFTTALAVREPSGAAALPAPRPRNGFLRSTLAALGNRAFAPLFAMYTTVTIGLSASAVLALYYYEYRLGLTLPQIYAMTAAFVTALCLSLPGWVAVSRLWGKKWPALVGGLVFGTLTAVGYPILPAGLVWPPLLLGLVGGVCGGSLVLLYALAADIVDYDEALSGLPREGLYFGLWNMGTKMARALAVGAAGVLLHRIGFIPNQEQTPEVLRALALIYGPGVGAFLILGSLVFLRMPAIEERREQVRRVLARRARRRQRAAA